MTDHEYEAVARLLRVRNAIDHELAQLINRPVTTGHLGEWIAAKIFEIELHERASHKGSDGIFTTGRLAGRSVNVKWYTKRENSLDMSSSSRPDVYLVMTGPFSSLVTSRGSARPLCVDEVYLFDAEELARALVQRGAAVGYAASVRKQEWVEAQIYPATSALLPLSSDQRAALALLRGMDGSGAP